MQIMKNILPEFEKHSHNKLNQYEIPIDTDHLFSQLEPLINKKKKRRFGFWFFIPAGLICGALAYLSYTASLDSTKKSITLNPTTTELQQITNSIKNNENIKSVEPNITTDYTKNLKTTNTAQSDAAVKSEVNTGNSTDTYMNNRNSFKSGQTLTTTNKLNSLSSNKKQNVTTNNPTSQSSETSYTEEGTSMITNNLSVANFPIAHASDNRIADDKSREEFEIVSPLLRTKDYTFQPKFIFSRGNNCYSFNSNKKFYLDLSASYLLAVKQLSASSIQNVSYLELLQKNEKTLEGFGLEAAGLFFIQKNYYFRLGLGFNRITERYKHFKDGTRVDTVWGLKNIYIDPNGDSVIVYGNIPRITHFTQIFELYSYYNTFNIPFSLGYQLNKGNWAIRPELGAVLQFGKFQRGASVDENSTIYALKSKSDQMRHTPQLNIRFSTAVDYSINRNTRIYFSPRLYVLPNHFSNNKNPIDRNYYQIDFSLGLLTRL